AHTGDAIGRPRITRALHERPVRGWLRTSFTRARLPVLPGEPAGLDDRAQEQEMLDLAEGPAGARGRQAREVSGQVRRLCEAQPAHLQSSRDEGGGEVAAGCLMVLDR